MFLASALLSPYLTQPLNIFHVQDSCGSGRTCSVILHSFEESLAELSPFASIAIVHPDDAFDHKTLPESTIKRIKIPKELLETLGLLDGEGSVRRSSHIFNQAGDLLCSLFVPDEEDLVRHVREQLLPELKRLA